MKILVVIPTYNERENIPELIEQLAALPTVPDLLFIDDGSPDGTAELIKTYQGEGKPIYLIERDGKQGLATAYLSAFQWALERDYLAVVQMDADLSHQPKHLMSMLPHLADFDLVVGSRYTVGGAVENWPWSRRVLSRGGSLYAKLILSLPISDLTGGYNIWHRDLLLKMGLDTIKSTGYCFQIEMKHRALESGAKHKEVPITFIERRLGQSKIDRRIILEAIWRTWLIRFRSKQMVKYKKFVKYSLVGATGMSMDIALMVCLVELAGWHPLSASVVSFAVSVSNNFIWNKLWTFRDTRNNYLKQYSQFFLAALVGLGINYIMMDWLLDHQVNYVLARFIVVAFIVLWNFFINSLWTFRPVKNYLSTDA